MADVQTVEMKATENVARALASMWFTEIDDHAVDVIARHELSRVAGEVSEIAEGADVVPPEYLHVLADRLNGIADAIREMHNAAEVAS